MLMEYFYWLISDSFQVRLAATRYNHAARAALSGIQGARGRCLRLDCSAVPSRREGTVDPFHQFLAGWVSPPAISSPALIFRRADA